MSRLIKTSKVSKDYQAPLPEAKATPQEERLRLFDEASHRQREREAEHLMKEESDRGWKREDLYSRGRAD